jgi:hypothetical protein
MTAPAGTPLHGQRGALPPRPPGVPPEYLGQDEERDLGFILPEIFPPEALSGPPRVVRRGRGKP